VSSRSNPVQGINRPIFVFINHLVHNLINNFLVYYLVVYCTIYDLRRDFNKCTGSDRTNK
jgi:hypothetical protein